MKTCQLVISFFLFCAIDHNTFAFVGKSHQCRSFGTKTTQVWRTKTPDDGDETADLQVEINKLVEDPPIFSSWDASNFDEKALPVPLFTAQIVSLASIALTVWIYYLAFNPPSNPPTP